MRWISKYMNTQSMENGSWSQPGHHAQQGKLAQVQSSSGWWTASKQVHHWSWCTWVQTKKALKCHLVVVIKSIKFRLAQYQ